VYEYLEGTVVRHTPAHLVLGVGGVGYSLCVPVGSPFRAGTEVRAWTHLVVREDAQLLYGFAEARQRDFFRLLLSVRGVGPAMALTLLSGIDTDRLIEAIIGGDTSSLVCVKGVGKKTAEQILLDLRDRVEPLLALRPGASSPAAAGEGRDASRLADAVSALVSMGYKEKDAQKRIASVAKGESDLDLEGLVRAALRG
jgi:holliday junction DNA helicase RuvA